LGYAWLTPAANEVVFDRKIERSLSRRGSFLGTKTDS
jgi:hypothetical protein